MMNPGIDRIVNERGVCTGYRWTVHPAAGRPGMTAVALMVVGIVLGAVYRFSGELIYCAVALGILMVTLAPYFQKTRYEADETGIRRRLAGVEKHLSWSAVRSWEPARRGIYLVAGDSKKVVSSRNGMLIMVDSGQEEIIDWIKRKMG